jgi:hypothetical protein
MGYETGFVARYDVKRSRVVLEMGDERTEMLSVFVVGEVDAARMEVLTRRLFDLAAACWSPGREAQQVRMVALDEHGYVRELPGAHALCGSRCVGGDPRTCGG